MTATKPTVHEALAAVLAAVDAIGKTRHNTQQGFRFRGVDDVMNGLHPLLARHHVIVVPEVLERLAETRQTQRGGAMNVVHLHVRFTFHGPAGDTLVGSAWGEAMDSADKATGKAHSTALKTFLLQAFMVPTEDLEDADAGGEPAAPLDAERLRAEQDQATATRNGERTGRDLLRELHLSANDAVKTLKAESSSFAGLTIPKLLALRGEELDRAAAYLRAAGHQQPA